MKLYTSEIKSQTMPANITNTISRNRFREIASPEKTIPKLKKVMYIITW
jgi:hypothetical protein